MNVKINQDAEFCGKVPLHQTNLIQPHGVLLVVAREELTIIQASDNANRIFGIEARDLVQRSLREFISEAQAEQIHRRFDGSLSGQLPFSFSFSSGEYMASIQANQQYLVVEIERESRTDGQRDSFLQIYQELKYVMAAVDAAATTEETCNIAIRELRNFSGFDKIMIYKFDEDWNGDVIAEIKEPEMDAYLGLKFPASDIPRQARELYRKMPYRLIPDANYEPVRLYPVINPLTNSFTDLSNSNLRSVAGVHIEYLKNMGVVASMSTRILVDGQLWGLIACHHRSAKFLTFEMCSVFELLSNIISAKISAMQKEDVFGYRNRMQQVYAGLVEEVYREESLGLGLEKQQGRLLDLLKADGVTVVLNNRVNSFGETPADTDIEDLVLWLQSGYGQKMYHQPHLSSVYEPAEKYATVASGLLALPVQPDKGSYILAFRPEAVRKVNWSGNPNEAIRFEADRKNYHPRNSFQLWQQTVKENSVPWSPEELDVAEQFRNFVVEYTLNKVYN